MYRTSTEFIYLLYCKLLYYGNVTYKNNYFHFILVYFCIYIFSKCHIVIKIFETKVGEKVV